MGQYRELVYGRWCVFTSDHGLEPELFYSEADALAHAAKLAPMAGYRNKLLTVAQIVQIDTAGEKDLEL